MKSKFSILCDVIFLVRLQGNLKLITLGSERVNPAGVHRSAIITIGTIIILMIMLVGKISIRLIASLFTIRPQCLARLQPQCFTALDFIMTRSEIVFLASSPKICASAV